MTNQKLEHVLGSCKTAFGNGRYTWRHNRVLEELVEFIKNYMKSEPTISSNKFASEKSRIYAGSKQTIKHRAVPGQKLLGSSRDWKVSVDQPGWHNNYPKTISSKGLRPNIVLLSMVNLKIIVVELSITNESRMDQSHEYKTSKYEDLKKGTKRNDVVCYREKKRGVNSPTHLYLNQLTVERRYERKSIPRTI